MNKPILPTSAIISSFVDIGCTNNIVLNGNVPVIGTPSWSVAGVAEGVSVFALNATAVSVSGIFSPLTLRYTIAFQSCASSSADVFVKRYNQVSAPSGIASNFSIGCQSSFFLPSDAPIDGYGKWSVTTGSGSVVDSADTNGTAVTSVSSRFNLYTFTVSGLGCVAKTALTTVQQSDPTSIECVGCQIVSLGKDAFGNETFVNTCDPPVPLVVTNTEQPIRFTVEITMKSLSVGSNADVVFNASVIMTGTMTLATGSTLAIGSNSTLTVQTIDAQNSTITCSDGASIVVSGNVTSKGAVFDIVAGNMTITGSVTFDNATTFSAAVANGASLFVNGEMSFAGRLIMAVLQTLLKGGKKRASATTSVIEVVRYGSASGSFGEIRVNYADPCSEVASVTPSYGPSAMSVVLSVRSLPSCDSGTVEGVVGAGSSGGPVTSASSTGGLSSEAIVGLVVSLSLVLTAIMVVLVLASRARRLKKADEHFRKQMTKRGSIHINTYEKPNPAFGQGLEGEVASQPAAPVLSKRYTMAFNANVVDIAKQKEEEAEEENATDTMIELDDVSLPPPTADAREPMVL